MIRFSDNPKENSRMTATPATRSAKGSTLRLDEIVIPETARAYHAFNTVAIAAAIRSGKTPAPVLNVVERAGRFELVEGRDEFATLRLAGAETALVHIVEEPRRDWRRAHLVNHGEH